MHVELNLNEIIGVKVYMYSIVITKAAFHYSMMCI